MIPRDALSESLHSTTDLIDDIPIGAAVECSPKQTNRNALNFWCFVLHQLDTSCFGQRGKYCSVPYIHEALQDPVSVNDLIVVTNE